MKAHHLQSGWSAPLSQIRPLLSHINVFNMVDPRLITDVGEPSVVGPTTNPQSPRHLGQKDLGRIARFIDSY